MVATAANMTDYERERRSFALDVPEFFNFAVDVIDRWAEDPNRVGMVWVGTENRSRTLTFRDFAWGSNRAARVFRQHGIGKGDRVLVVASRVPEWWEALLGLMKLGAVAAPGTTQLTARDMKYRLELSQAKAAIVDVENARKLVTVRGECPQLQTIFVIGGDVDGCVRYETAVAEQPRHVEAERTRADDELLLYFTSGTTGYPKMVLHTHASYGIGHQITGKYWLDLKPSDLHWTLSDTGWAKAAWGCLFGPWSQGAALFIQDVPGRFDPVLTLKTLQDYGVTTFCAPPTAYRLLVLEDLKPYDLSALRHCVGAGEPLNPEVIDAWQAGTGMTIRDGYGQTETVLIVGNFPPIEVRPGSMGKPSPGFEIAVIDENGTPREPGEEGDIAIRVRPNRPVGLFREYWNDAEATKNCIRGDWYITGDRAYMDGDGYFWFVGRADDVIISAGYRIGPFEVESALLEHPAVVEAAVVASPDPVRGEIVKAFVVLGKDAQPGDKLAEELQDHVKRVTAPYKYPREVEFVTELPKTISGKIRRIELRQREAAKKTNPAEYRV
ncbi:MAG TPA: AMP-binding protein [Dehalococcoidia bacterium]|nr:AMP-binding protein [Dehalococcoidia bacterium]